MNHTALAADLSDNAYVQEKRAQLQCYSAQGDALGTLWYYLPLYPSGMCTSTLDDFVTFACALLPESETPLFERRSTLDTMLSPTCFYGDTGIAVNCHGLWTSEYRIQTVGHGGNTMGCSASLLLSPEYGIGCVIMTNQRSEAVFCLKMPELIFGSFQDSPLYGYNDQVPGGIWRTARTTTKGPLSVFNSILISVFSDAQLEEFWVYEDSPEGTRVMFSGGHLLKLEPKEYIPMLVFLFFGLIALDYAVNFLIVEYGIVMPIVRRRRKRQGLPVKTQITADGWNLASCAVMVAVAINLIVVILRADHFEASAHFAWQFALMGVLGLALLVLELLLPFRWKKLACGKLRRVQYIATAVLMLFVIGMILYWQMYAFWTI